MLQQDVGVDAVLPCKYVNEDDIPSITVAARARMDATARVTRAHALHHVRARPAPSERQTKGLEVHLHQPPASAY